jgi:hypothetical protein
VFLATALSTYRNVENNLVESLSIPVLLIPS